MDPNEQTISLDDEIDEKNGAPELVTLDDKAARQIPQDVAEKRAVRADYGLGPDSPGRDAIVNAIGSGTEDALRGTAAAQKEMKEVAQRAKTMLGVTTKQEPLTQRDVDLFHGSNKPPVVDPGVVFELGYGQRIVNDIATNNPDSSSVMNKAISTDPTKTYDHMDVASDIIAKQGILEKVLEDRKADWQATSWWDAAPDLAEGFVPLLSAARLHNAAGVDGGLLPGDNMEAQVQGLLLLGPSEFKKKLEATTDSLYEKNPQDAIKFLEAVKSYGSDDKYLDSVLGIADALGLAEGGVGGIRGLARLTNRAATKLPAEAAADIASRQSSKALKDAVKASAQSPSTPEDIFAAVGQVDKAADITALRKVGILPTTGMTDAEVLARNLPSAARVQSILSAPGTLSREASDRLAAKLNQVVAGTDEALGITVRNTRLEPAQVQVAIDEANASLRREFEKTTDSIIDVKTAVITRPEPDLDRLGFTFKGPEAGSNAKGPGTPSKTVFDSTNPLGDTGRKTISVNGETVGFVELTKSEGKIHIDHIEVHKGARRKGYSTQLIEDLKKEFPGSTIDPGIMTKDGSAFFGKVSLDGVAAEPSSVKRILSRPAENIVDIRHNVIEQNNRNVETMTIELGAPNAVPFPTEDLARFYADDMYGLQDHAYSVKQVGDGFTLEVTRPFDEISGGVRQALETSVVDPHEGIGSFMDFIKQPNRVLPGYVKGADENLSAFQVEQRKAVQFGFNQTLGIVKEMVQPIAALSKAEKTALEKVLKYNRDFFDTKTGDRGFFYENVAQLEDGFHRANGRLPSQGEIEAYFTYTQLSDIDWGIRNFSLYRDKARLGLKQFNFEFSKPDAGGANFPRTPDFEGKIIDNLPWHGEPASVLHVEDGGKKVSVFNTKEVNPETYTDMIENGGYKVIQVDNPVNRPFTSVLDNREIVQYVLTKEFKQSELSLKQLDYNPGGHVEYQHDWFLKQPRISTGRGGQKFYEGDTAIFNFTTEAQTAKFEKAMNEARVLLKDGKLAEMSDLVRKRLPYTPDQFRAMFSGEEALAMDQKFHVVKRGRSIMQDNKYIRSDNPGIRDYTDSSHNLSGEANRKFVGARNGPLMTVQSAGSDSNPLMRLANAKTIDPLQTMGRSLSNAVNNRFFGDYKIGAVEDFISRYADSMKTSIRDLQNNPMYFLHNPEWDWSRTNFGKVTEAMNARRSIMNFVGEQGVLGRQVEFTKQKLYNSIFNTFGEDVATKVVNKTTATGTDTIDPAGYFRAVGFHTKLGFFNPKQYVIQAMGATHVMAISPKNGLNAALSYFPTRFLGEHPSEELIEAAAQKMGKLGLWKPEEFAESYRAMKQVGWDKVGAEHAWKDNIADPKIFAGEGGTFLDKGSVFFNEGERVNRITAWHAAYRDWREANPLKNLDSEQLRKVLNRADLMGANMTRASAASWQKGILSIPTQFMGYNARLMDQFLGKRLTVAEKGRMFAVYSSLYGIPASIGLTGAPAYDDIRTAALERGWNVDNRFFQALHEGILSTVTSMVSGKDYNYAQRFGPGGITLLKDIASGDKSPAELIAGASGNILGDTLKAGSSIIKDFYETTKSGGKYEPVFQDIVDVARNISSVNEGYKIMTAMNVGKYYTKNGQLMGDMTGTDAIFGALTGLQPMEFSDSYLKQKSGASQKEHVEEVFKEYAKQMRLGTNEAQKGNTEGAAAFYKKARAAMIVGDINESQQGLLLQRYLKDQEAMIDRGDAGFVNNAPASQFKARNEERVRKMEQ